MSAQPNCLCDAFIHPAPIANPPGRSKIRYRAGDFSAFRHALLLSLPGELELVNWKPSTTSDLALQMIEWWAYLADILTFYNERAANQDYLRTADLSESVNRLIRVLGYRPKPGIGAAATLAALVTAKKPITLPAGFAIQSKPGPGKQPQIFELSAPAILQPGGLVSADPAPSNATLGATATLLLQGTITSINTGDQLVLMERGWTAANKNYSVAYVTSVTQETSPRGTKNTRVHFGAPLGLPTGATAAQYRLLRSTRTTRLWQYNGGPDSILGNNNDGTGIVHVESVTRDIHPGDPILFDNTQGKGSGVTPGSSVHPVSVSFHLHGHLPGHILFVPPLQLSSVANYTEALWYANSPDDPPTTPPPASSNTPGIAILHSQMTFTPVYAGAFDPSTILIHYGWQDAGVLIPTPAAAFTGAPSELLAVTPLLFATGPVLLEDANGNGESANGLVSAGSVAIQLSNLSDPAAAFAAPINVYSNLFPVTRGKTVTNEILGSGDSGAPAQEFVVSKSPVTYLFNPNSNSGSNYSSTLRIWVNGVEWMEAPSFYAQPPKAAIFVTREDENNTTHVQFGDGVNGARLPSSANNVVASYRYGSGKEAPAAGALTLINQAQPGLSAVRNPVAAGGGADPEPASQIRKYAPLSVLTFGRAVSGQDYEAIAASTPGVDRARAYWTFDAVQQRALVTVYVGDEPSSSGAARKALAGTSDPNRPLSVKPATAVPIRISFTLRVDPAYVLADVAAAVRTAILDADTGLFGSHRIGIGEVIYTSRIYAASLSVTGAVSVQNLAVFVGGAAQTSYRFDPGEGSYFTLDGTALNIAPEVASNAG